MKIYINPPAGEWDALCRRVQQNNATIAGQCAQILTEVKEGGDKALKEISKRIDGYCPERFEVTAEEFVQAEKEVSDQLKEAIGTAAANITKFHSAQIPQPLEVNIAPGVLCCQKPVPIQRVGLYIPGGSAPLFSTVLMLAIPAKLAGCREVIMCTPAGKGGKIASQVLYAAKRCGVDKVYKIGGAQAIAAMAYGTEEIGKVDKIFGPGNRYVTTAKQLVSGENTAIDMPAGPSEVMVLADGSARAEFVAADLLSQAEHGADSQAMVVCNSADLASRIAEEVEESAKKLGRINYIEKSLEESRIIVFEEREKIIAFANRYAAEHLIISLENPWEAVEEITAAGSIFVGNWSPESAGDYASGTNHTLPTSGWAHSCSGVNIESFIRRITIQELTREGIGSLAPVIIEMAEAEGLQAHAEAVKIRIKQ